MGRFARRRLVAISDLIAGGTSSSPSPIGQRARDVAPDERRITPRNQKPGDPMTPIETATLITSAIAIAIGGPLAFFHHRIACELRHLRAHFFTHHAAHRRAAPSAPCKRHVPRHKA
jgi:hypothetical protein